MSQLHFLRLFADHDEQHKAEHDAGENQHFSIRQFAMCHERQHGDDAGEK